MSAPTVYADFNNADQSGRLRLNLRGTEQDLQRLSIELSEGLEITLSDGELTANGVARFSANEQIWVAEIDWGEIRDG